MFLVHTYSKYTLKLFINIKYMDQSINICNKYIFLYMIITMNYHKSIIISHITCHVSHGENVTYRRLEATHFTVLDAGCIAGCCLYSQKTLPCLDANFVINT